MLTKSPDFERARSFSGITSIGDMISHVISPVPMMQCISWTDPVWRKSRPSATRRIAARLKCPLLVFRDKQCEKGVGFGANLPAVGVGNKAYRNAVGNIER